MSLRDSSVERNSAGEVAGKLAESVEALVQTLLPNGHREGHEWRAGNVSGEAGNSLGVHLRGAKPGVWADFATGECGDALDLVAAARRLDTAGALAWAQHWLAGDPDKTTTLPIGRAGTKQANPDPARWIKPWTDARRIGGTLAETYLRNRHVPFDDPEGRVLRFRHRHARQAPDGGLKYHPALIAAISDVRTGAFAGIHNVYLQPDGHDRIRDKKGKTTWGRAGAVTLDPFDAVTMGLVLAEGLETGIALHLDGVRPVWVTCGAGNLRNFPILSSIEALTIAADPDQPGRAAAEACARRWRDAGREACIITPPAGDWAATRAGRAAA
jgi:Toprim domain